MRELLRDLERLTVFMICAQMIVYFRPKKSYEKYLRLLMSFLILLEFLKPVQKLFLGETRELRLQWETFQEELQEELESVELEGFGWEEEDEP